MTIFSERNSKEVFIPKWTLIEHDQRYWFANQYLKDKIVVDCACGTGLGTKIYMQAVPKQLYGYDVSELAVEEARNNNRGNAAEINQASATELPLPDASVDVYVSFETIEHIDADRQYIKEALRVLKPGGIFLCSTPNRDVTNPGSRLDQNPINPFHTREYSSQEFFNLLSEDFVILERYGQILKPSIVQTALKLASILSHPIPARIHQVFKVLLFLLCWSHKKEPEKITNNASGFEFLIAVCQKP